MTATTTLVATSSAICNTITTAVPPWRSHVYAENSWPNARARVLVAEPTLIHSNKWATLRTKRSRMKRCASAKRTPRCRLSIRSLSLRLRLLIKLHRLLSRSFRCHKLASTWFPTANQAHSPPVRISKARPSDSTSFLLHSPAAATAATSTPRSLTPLTWTRTLSAASATRPPTPKIQGGPTPIPSTFVSISTARSVQPAATGFRPNALFASTGMLCPVDARCIEVVLVPRWGAVGHVGRIWSMLE